MFSLLIRGGGCESKKITLRSLLRQGFPDWEVIVAEADETAKAEIATCCDGRLSFIPEAESSAPALSDLASKIRGIWLLDIRAGALLADDALSVLARAVSKCSEAIALYADVVLTDTMGKVVSFHLKPAWSPDLYDAIPYPAGLVGVRVEAVASFPETEGSFSLPWYFHLLRQAGRIPGAVCHVAEVLLAMPLEQTEPWPDMDGRIQYLRSVHAPDVLVMPAPDALPGAIRIIHPIPQPPPLVDVIIPTCNGGKMLQRCLESIFAHTNYPAFQVTIVDNLSDDPGTMSYLRDISSRPGVRVLKFESAFNFSAINNMAVTSSVARVVCLLNDDVEVTAQDWLRELVSHALRPEVGAVGARLLYPDGRVQHAGIIVGLRRSAAHSHKGFAREAAGYMGRLRLVQNCTAVTAACLAVTREKYLAVGGMDEEFLPVAYNDVDFCLKLRRAGYLNVWTPYAELFHHESATRGKDTTPEKRARLKEEAGVMNERWGIRDFQDPYYHPALTRRSEDFAVAAKPWPLRRQRQIQCR